MLMSRGSRCRCGTHLRPETMTHTHAACYQCQPASAHTINLPLNDKMIIHTHNGELFEMHSGCVRVPQRFATKKWNENGQKTNRGPNGILFMVFFVHVDLLRCPSPVPLPPPLPLTTTTKTTFMKFVLFHVLLDVEWWPCPLHFEQIELKWNKRKYAINMRSRWKVIRRGVFCCCSLCVCVCVLNPFMRGDNRFCCQFKVAAHHACERKCVRFSHAIYNDNCL